MHNCLYTEGGCKLEKRGRPHQEVFAKHNMQLSAHSRQSETEKVHLAMHGIVGVASTLRRGLLRKGTLVSILGKHADVACLVRACGRDRQVRLSSAITPKPRNPILSPETGKCRRCFRALSQPKMNVSRSHGTNPRNSQHRILRQLAPRPLPPTPTNPTTFPTQLL